MNVWAIERVLELNFFDENGPTKKSQRGKEPISMLILQKKLTTKLRQNKRES